ncbi:MAG: hypothetical protein KDA80_08710, partial [Planctomycetaceae bacterium]|nr:hypothetical protein [Planctomycetaceae bacterium]
YAGASVPSLDQLAEQGIRGILTPQLAIAFALLGLTPLLIRKLVTWFRPQTSLPGNASDSVRSDGEPASDEKKT